MEVLAHKGACHSVVERSFVPLDEAHFGGSIANKTKNDGGERSNELK
jgi:hypothetical protein